MSKYDLLVDMALSQYIGQKCSICGREYLNLEILKESNLVCTRKEGEELSFGCKICFNSVKKSEGERT